MYRVSFSFAVFITFSSSKEFEVEGFSHKTAFPCFRKSTLCSQWKEFGEAI